MLGHSVGRRWFLMALQLLAGGPAMAATPMNAHGGWRGRLIATEEAFVTADTRAATAAWMERHPGEEPVLRALYASFGPIAAQWFHDLPELGTVRTAAMHEAGIDVQLLLHSSPGVQLFAPEEGARLAILVNDRVAEAARASSGRYAPLATVAPQAPELAAREIERAVRQLGMHGVLINSHTRGEYLDDSKFWPIFEAAEALDAPIYLHPREPSPAMAGPYQPHGMLGPIWGFAADTGLHALRILLAGVFDRFPRLQLVLGHLGEGLPYFIDRVDIRYREDGSPQRTTLKRLPSDYLRDNFHVTTSGMNWEPAVRLCLEVMGPDRVQFAADWPFENATEAARRFRAMRLDTDVHAKVAHRNAERLWRIPPAA